MINNIFVIEKGFINTKHPDFAGRREIILGNKILEQKSLEQQGMDPNNANKSLKHRHSLPAEPQEKETFWDGLFGGNKNKKTEIGCKNDYDKS